MATSSATRTRKKSVRKWSKHVIETSNALDIKQGIFRSNDPKKRLIKTFSRT